MTCLVGLAANPDSGKDIRRVAAGASVFDNQEKRAVVARCLAGIAAADPSPSVLYLDDLRAISRSAVATAGVAGTPVAGPRYGNAQDTVRAAAAMRKASCGAVISLGGDGTNRALAKGWLDAPLVPISTGTNNVFPGMQEGSAAGAAAALVASGSVALRDVAPQVKVIHVEIEGEADDIALIDAVATDDRFVGARALLSGDRLIAAVLTRAIPSAVGITSIAGLLEPMSDEDDGAMTVDFIARGRSAKWHVRAPIAPGRFDDIAIADARRVGLGETVEIVGPCVLAFDGERERVMKAGQRARLSVRRDGPRVIDIKSTLEVAARDGAMLFPTAEGVRHAG